MNRTLAHTLFMVDRATLAERLRDARIKAGFEKPVDAARAFGWEPPTYYGHENGSRGLTPDAAERYGKAFRVKPAWLLGLEPNRDDPPTDEPQLAPTGDVDTSRIIDLPDRISMPLNVPVYGVAVGGSNADFQMNGEVVDYVRRPPGLMNARRAFAIYVQGDSMEPRYEAGDLVYLNPDRPARNGDDVVIQMKPNGHKPGDCFIKRLVRRTLTHIVCKQFNPPCEVVYAADEVDAVFKVMTNAEQMGV